MSTYGEIVEPVSRTAWEDWDDVSEQNTLTLKWQLDAVGADAIDTLLVFEGKYLHDIITKQMQSKLELINYIKEVSLHLYMVESQNKYICVIKDYNLLQSSEIVELLKPYISVSKNAVAVLTKPLAEYQSFELSNQTCVIRAVSTTKSPLSGVQLPKLEQPNIISGVSAGVICLREHLGLSGEAIICYMEHPEEYPVEEVQMLLKKLDIILSNAQPTNVLNSNLYI